MLKRFQNIEIIGFLVFTLWAISQGQTTVFYIIYLFWFQEFIRTIINILYSPKKNREEDGSSILGQSLGSFFVLFIYFVFIVVLFCFMLNWGNTEILVLNIQTLVFRNLYFNLNLLFFTLQYLVYRIQAEPKDVEVALFNRNHMVLHISIILGAVIQMGFVKRFPEYLSGKELWGSALVLIPFLVLKIWIGNRRSKDAIA